MVKLRVRAALSAMAAGILIAIGGCTEQSPTVVADPDVGDYRLLEVGNPAGGAPLELFGPVRVTKVIGPDGGVLEITGGHTLTFPAGALSEPTTISARVDTRYLGADFGPEGLRFPEGRNPVLKLNYSHLGAIPYRSIAVGYIAPTGRILEVLDTEVDPAGKTLAARLSHFSGYVAIGT